MPTINKHRIKEKAIPYKHQAKENEARFYNLVSWRNLRNSYIKQHPFCELCEAEGRIRLAEEIHHRKPYLTGANDEEKLNLLLDEDNLMSLCRDCHHKIHNELRAKKK